MYLKIAEYIFVFVAVLLSILFSLRVYLPDMFKNSNKFSPVMAFLGALVLLYVLNSLVLVLFLPNIIYKFIMLLFAASPFIIGKLVRYEKLKFYSTIQILCVILSLVFVILV